jgi:hypothetical protein
MYQVLLASPGSFAIFTAIRRASSCVSNFAAERRFFKIDVRELPTVMIGTTKQSALRPTRADGIGAQSFSLSAPAELGRVVPHTTIQANQTLTVRFQPKS